jgi:hypothetical protein
MPSVRAQDFNARVALPPGLDIAAVRRAIEHIQKGTGDLVDLYFEQANIFSGLVGIFGTRALDAFSVYERSKHSYTAQQRFPDLRRRGAREPLQPDDCLESKASKRAWELQSHYNHAGWYIVWRYLVDPTETIEPGCPVVIWRVDVVKLSQNDWKYEQSSAGTGRGGRTHTFGVRRAAKRLQDCAVYMRSDIQLKGSKPVPVNGH